MYQRATCLCFVLIFFIVAPLTARAGDPTLESTPVSPGTTVDPDTFVTFSVIPSGFGSGIQYAVLDSSSATGATTAVIDTSGIVSWRPTADEAGPHVLTIVATDVDEATASVSVPFFVTGSFLSLSNVSPGPTLVPGRTLSFQITATGYSSPSFTVYDTRYGSSLGVRTLSDGLFSWTPTVDDVGDHQLKVFASDSFGHADTSNLQIRVVNPIVSIEGIANHTISTADTATFTASVPLFTNTTFSVSDVATGTTTLTSSAINSTTGRFSWRPSLDDVGTHFLTVTATDTFGNVASSSTHYWVVEGPSTPPLAPVVQPSLPVSPLREATSAPLANQFRFTKNLAVGARSQAVSELQKRLKALGYYTGPVTGYYGALTAAAVKKLQRARGLPTVGSLGPATRAYLNSLK